MTRRFGEAPTTFGEWGAKRYERCAVEGLSLTDARRAKALPDQCFTARVVGSERPA